MASHHASSRSNFVRYPEDGYVGGVCAGVAAFLDWNVRLIRALAVLTLIFGGFFPIVLVYGLLWYVMEDAQRPAPARHHRGRNNETRAEDHPLALRARFARLEQRLSQMEDCVTSGEYELRRELRKLEP